MTLYARSDLAYVIVPAPSGGCGSPHRRPVENGAPAKLWPLECPGQCEEFLRKSDASGHQWSATLSEIPETHDERVSREDFDKRGARDKDQVLALALAKLAGVELPESMLRPITGNLPKAMALMECPSGHPGKPGAKFCAVCGEPMQQPVNALPAAPVLCPEGHQNAPGGKFCATCGSAMAPETPQAQDASRGHTPPGGPGPAARKVRLRDMRLEDLQAVARERGVDPDGTRMDLIGRLRAQPAEVAA